MSATLEERAEFIADLIEVAEADGETGVVYEAVKNELIGFAEKHGSRAATDALLLALIQRARSARRYFDATQTFFDAVMVADGPVDAGAARPGLGDEACNVILFPGERA